MSDFVVNSAAVIYAVSAGICFEAYAEAGVRGIAPLLGSLMPGLNTVIALFYARDKLARN